MFSLSNFFKRMMQRIKERVEKHRPGLYLALLFPIMFAFVVTFTVSRLFAYFAPHIYLETSAGLHIHHFTYGIFILSVAGYLALLFDGPKAKFWIALLFGVGLGLAFDEFGMWLKLSEEDPIRLEYDGLLIIMGLVIFIATIKPGLHFIFKHLPFRTGK